MKGDSEPEKGFYYRSDHFPFAKKGVPALYSDSGSNFTNRPEGWGAERRREYVTEIYHKPQDQIDAFRAFQIPTRLQEQFGYPALTPTARAKIFGLNAASIYGIDPAAVRCAIDKDELARAKTARLDRPKPERVPGCGPETRAEFFAFLRARGGVPG